MYYNAQEKHRNLDNWVLITSEIAIPCLILIRATSYGRNVVAGECNAMCRKETADQVPVDIEPWAIHEGKNAVLPGKIGAKEKRR
jgi:hypothetical protein